MAAPLNTFRRLDFNSVQDMLNCYKNLQSKDPNHEVFYNGGFDWYGRHGIQGTEDVLEEMNSHWDEGLRLFSKMMEKINTFDLPEPISYRRRAKWNEVQGEFGTDRFLAGSPDFYRRATRLQCPSNRVISLFIDGSMNACQSYREALINATASIALADRLEDAGFSVEIKLLDTTVNIYSVGLPNVILTTTLKEAGVPVNVESLLAGTSCLCIRGVIYPILKLLEKQEYVDYNLGHPDRTLPKSYYCEDPSTAYVLQNNIDYSLKHAMDSVKKVLESIKEGAYE